MFALALFAFTAPVVAQSLPTVLTMPKDSSIGDASGANFKSLPASEGVTSGAVLLVTGENGVVYRIKVYETTSAQTLRDRFTKLMADASSLSQTGDTKVRTGTFTGRSIGDVSYVYTARGKDLPDRLDVIRGKFLIQGSLARRRDALDLKFERANSLYLEKLVRAALRSLDAAVAKVGH